MPAAEIQVAIASPKLHPPTKAPILQHYCKKTFQSFLSNLILTYCLTCLGKQKAPVLKSEANVKCQSEANVP